MKRYLYPSSYEDNTKYTNTWIVTASANASVTGIDTLNEESIVTRNKEINICINGYEPKSYSMTFSSNTGFTINRILLLIPYVLMEFENNLRADDDPFLADGFCLGGFDFEETTSTAYIILDH